MYVQRRKWTGFGCECDKLDANDYLVCNTYLGIPLAVQIFKLWWFSFFSSLKIPFWDASIVDEWGLQKRKKKQTALCKFSISKKLLLLKKSEKRSFNISQSYGNSFSTKALFFLVRYNEREKKCCIIAIKSMMSKHGGFIMSFSCSAPN